MNKISLVTVKVVRRNEQYDYKIVGRGEKYLVLHNDGENAGEKTIAYLSPYVVEPIQVEQVILQKNTEVIGDAGKLAVFKATVEAIVVNHETGKQRKESRCYYVNGDSIKEAFDELVGFISEISLSAEHIRSISRTNIIEVI